jgi:hypothetical protein
VNSVEQRRETRRGTGADVLCSAAGVRGLY